MATKKERPRPQGFEKTSKLASSDNLFDSDFHLNDSNDEEKPPDDKKPDSSSDNR